MHSSYLFTAVAVRRCLKKRSMLMKFSDTLRPLIAMSAVATVSLKSQILFLFFPISFYFITTAPVMVPFEDIANL